MASVSQFKARSVDSATTSIIAGYSATAQTSVEYSVDYSSVSPTKGAPLSLTSRPVIELLSGARSVASTRAYIHTHRGDAAPKGAAQTAVDILLVMLHAENAGSAIAFVRPSPGSQVMAAVKLSATAEGWTAEPLAIFMPNLLPLIAVRFRSPSVQALLTLTEQSFSRVLSPAREAGARLDFVRRWGTQFTPSTPDPHKWRIACRWPSWQFRKLSFPAREHELRIIENRNQGTDECLRQLCSRYLKLRIGDATDS